MTHSMKITSKRLMKIARVAFIALGFVTGLSYQGICGFNPFEQRRIVIDRFENRGEPRYDYVKESIEASLYDYALSIPFVSLTDEEIVFLKTLSGLDNYRGLFEEAGGRIRYSLEPSVTRGEIDDSEFPITIRGFYIVDKEEEVSLSLSAHNGMTERTFTEYQTAGDLLTILNEPEAYLVPFFKQFLRYKTHTVSISAVPDDSLLMVDGRLIGIGKSAQVLLSPGYHRITAMREGYRSFSDLVYIDRDGYKASIELKEEKKQAAVRYTTVPPGMRVYAGERYEGETPLSVSISKEDRTLTFVKEGYVQKTLYTQEAAEATQEQSVELLTEEEKEKILNKAELHRKGSETLFYTGIGMLGLSIILGMESTATLQQADLYRGVDSARHAQALDTTNTLNYLTAASSVITAGIFVFSFIEMLNYFDLYNYNERAAFGTLLKKEVRF